MRVILSKEQIEKDHFKVRDEGKEDAFASQTAEIKKLNHSRDALRYRSVLKRGQMFFCKLGCARYTIWYERTLKEEQINSNNDLFKYIFHKKKTNNNSL